MKEKLGFLLTAIKPVALGIGLYFLVFYVFHPFIVSGSSMYPTFEDQDVVFSSKNFSKDTLNYGDIVICKVKRGMVIKRIVALPGDMVQIYEGKLYVNGELSEYNYDYISEAGLFIDAMTLNKDQFVVMGDNRNHSQDSREYGPLTMKNIKYLVTRKVIGKRS